MNWQDFLIDMQKAGPVDPNAVVQAVLRESYLQTMEDLRYYAEKVKHFNESKKVVRDYLMALREYDATTRATARERGIRVCSRDDKDVRAVSQLMADLAHAYDFGDIQKELGIPARVPRAEVSNLRQLATEITAWEDRLNALGDDAQLANIDLQNMLQKQQQALQMITNISKMHHDTVSSITRNLGG